MYGLILEGIADFVRNKYGVKVWQEVLYVSGVDTEVFGVGII
jgi:hypothetical protein